MRAVTGAQVKAMDAYALRTLKIEELELIERSGGALFHSLEAERGQRCCVLCGGGNNGADGLAVASLLQKAGRQVTVILVSRKQNAACLTLLERAKKSGCQVIAAQGQEEAFVKALEECDFILDGIFGTGFSCKRENQYAGVINAVNLLSKKVYAIDIPSGVDGDNGEASPAAIRADVTLTLAYYKPGLFIHPGAQLCGQVLCLDIGMPPEAILREEALFTMSDPQMHRALLPKRQADNHKGTFGHLLLLGGSRGMAGSIALAARAAMRVGAGRVTVGCPESIEHIISMKLDEAMTLPLPCDQDGALSEEALSSACSFASGAQAVAAGCGMRAGQTQRRFVSGLIEHYEGPLVLDADALNVLAADPSVLTRRKGDIVLTPHPGELARLLGKTVEQVNQKRLMAARTFSDAYGVTVVLKGAGTIACFPDGTAFINRTGNPGMAKGGSGDMLTGMIGALLAQGLPVKDAVCCGVYLHGLSGDLCAKQYALQSYLPSDMIEMLKYV